MTFIILPLVVSPHDPEEVIEVLSENAEFFGVYIQNKKEDEFVWVNDFESHDAASSYINNRKRMH